MWVKVILLSLYILVVFYLSRLLEVTFWYHGDPLFFASHSVLDPLSLSVKKLCQLLDSRGVSYATAIEKPDLTRLVKSSGQVTEQELLDVGRSENSLVPPQQHPTVHFTRGTHFYEEVEDTKDSVWLVQVLAHDKQAPILNSVTWKQVVQKVSKYGVRTGIFKCSLDKKLCARKGWSSSLLILALPRGQHIKDDVVMHRYMTSSKLYPVLKWVNRHLSSQVSKIYNTEELKSEWLSTSRSPGDTPLRVILLSDTDKSPLFLSNLAIKFTGRIQFGIAQFDESVLRASLGDSVSLPSYPAYLVVTPEKVLAYGNKPGELYNFKSMELFLKTMHPEMNDIFLLSLVLVNMVIGLEFFLISGRFWRHCVRWVLQLVKLNCLLFLFWLLLMGAHQFKVVHSFTNLCLKCARYLGELHIATVLRKDYQYLYSTSFGVITFLIFGCGSTLVWKKMGFGQIHDDALFSDWWSVPWDSYVMNYFFRPMATLTRPMAPQDMDLEEGLELFIERLAVPNLWLLPVVQLDYLKDLPVWKYCNCLEEDSPSQDERRRSSGDSEDESGINSDHSCFEKFQEILKVSKPHLKCERSAKKSSKETASTSFKTTTCDKPSIKKSSTLVQKCRDWKRGFGSCFNTNKKTKENLHLQPLSIKIPVEESHKCKTHSHNEPTSVNQFQAPKSMLPFSECSICLENYSFGDSLCGLPCGHSFHVNCIMLWLTRDNHCCPICRWPSFKPKNHLHSN